MVDKIYNGEQDLTFKDKGSWSTPVSEYDGVTWSNPPKDGITPQGGHVDLSSQLTTPDLGGSSSHVVTPLTRTGESPDSSTNPTGQKIEGGVGPAVISGGESTDLKAENQDWDAQPAEAWKPDGSFLSWLGFLQLMWQGNRERTLEMSGIDGTGRYTFHTYDDVVRNDKIAASAFENWIIQYTNDINVASGMGLSWTSFDYLHNEGLRDLRDDMLTWWYNNVWQPGLDANNSVLNNGTGFEIGGTGETGGSNDSPLDTDKSATVGDVTMSMQEMEAQISNLLNLLYGGNLTQFSSGLIGFFRALSDYSDLLKLKDPSAKVNFIQNIYNALASTIQTQLSALYERENWLFQTDYNSPVNQMKRLMEAGINPAFYYSGLEKSNAGQVGSTQVQSPSTSAIQDTSASPMERLGQIAGAAGQIGGIFNQGIGAAGALVQNVASAKFSDENRIDLSETRPSRIAQMFGAASASQAEAAKTVAETPLASQVQQSTIDANKSTALFNRSNARALWRSLELKNKELDNAMEIARMSNATSFAVADLSSSATRYAALMGFKSTIAGVQGSALVNVLQNMYDDVEETVYEDATTGQTYTREQLRQNALESGVELGTGIEIPVFGIDANGKTSVKSSSLSSMKSGSTFTLGGHTYKSTTRQRKQFDPVRYKAAIQLFAPVWQGLKNGTVSNAQFNASISEIYGIVDDEQQKMLESISNNFANYHLQYVEGLTNGSFTGRVK